jgi:phosphatidylglycerol---prolipoprotein diacylglyceryl transferase
MKPIPTAFHIGPLQIHTYGIGLAITFYVAYRYFESRLKRRGYPTEWVGTMFVWVIISAIVGARLLHVVSNLSDFRDDPISVFSVWHGGLSSFGGLLFAVPTALFIAHRKCPELSILRGLDIVAPVLLAAWAMGRLLGPQLMVAGGGHLTNAWFGMAYDGQSGYRVPVPIIQAIEDATVYVVLLLVERRLDHHRDGSARVGYPPGIVTGIAMVAWGFTRTLDEWTLLAGGTNLGSVLVEFAGLCLIFGGIIILLRSAAQWRDWLSEQSPSANLA